MNNTGVVRKIDELGRIVVPKEIRKSLNIRNGEDVLIIVSNNDIILRKYEKLLSISQKAQRYIDIFAKLTKSNIIIIDFDKIIASNNKNLIDSLYNNQLSILLEDRKSAYYDGVICDDKKYHSYFEPIIVDADLIGGIIVFSDCDLSIEDKFVVSVINLLISDLFYE